MKCSKCREDTDRKGYCKKCMDTYNANKRIAKGIKPRTGMKLCNRCNTEKPINEFKSFYFCIECTKVRGGHGKNKKYTTEEIIQRRKESANKWRQKPEVRARLNEKKKEWSKENKHIRNKMMREWRKTENGRANDIVNTARRRSPNGDNFTSNEWRKLCEHYNNTCLCCGRNDVKLTPDHVKPLSKGGSNNIDNIQPLCLPCNLSKGTKEVDYR